MSPESKKKNTKKIPAGKPKKKLVISDQNVPEIISEGNPLLRIVAKEVPLKEISSSSVQQVILDMKKALASQSDGIGLAAPQIGISLRIFIVSKNIFSKDEPSIPSQDLVFINPVITKFSKEKKWMEGEGCLSVRYIYGKVKRSTKVAIRAYNEQGQVFERGAGGLLAHIFQHEVDHLDGILFIDKAKNLEHSEPNLPETQKLPKSPRPTKSKNTKS